MKTSVKIQIAVAVFLVLFAVTNFIKLNSQKNELVTSIQTKTADENKARNIKQKRIKALKSLTKKQVETPVAEPVSVTPETSSLNTDGISPIDDPTTSV